MGNYILTNKAVDDLSAIWNYSIEVWSEIQADKYYYMLLEHCQDLADDKALSKHYPEIGREISGARAGQHIIFFRKIKPNKIEVLRILHSRMDLKNRLKE